MSSRNQPKLFVCILCDEINLIHSEPMLNDNITCENCSTQFQVTTLSSRGVMEVAIAA